MLIRRKKIPPISLPIIFFGLAVCSGALLLHHPASRNNCGASFSWPDAFFKATSAVCVTGLTVVNAGSYFSRFGQNVILVLIQLGGLGIMTFTSLAHYFIRHRVSLTDRITVSQAVGHDKSFDMRQMLKALVMLDSPQKRPVAPFSFLLKEQIIFLSIPQVFHSVSAFCNAGFSFNDNSLIGCRGTGASAVSLWSLFSREICTFSVQVKLQRYLAAGMKEITEEQNHGKIYPDRRHRSWQVRL